MPCVTVALDVLSEIIWDAIFQSSSSGSVNYIWRVDSHDFFYWKHSCSRSHTNRLDYMMWHWKFQRGWCSNEANQGILMSEMWIEWIFRLSVIKVGVVYWVRHGPTTLSRGSLHVNAMTPNIFTFYLIHLQIIRRYPFIWRAESLIMFYCLCVDSHRG